MEKLTKQLQEILKWARQLPKNLGVKGVHIREDAPLNESVPAVLSIVTGGDGTTKLGQKEITADGEYYAYEDGLDGYSSVNVGITKNIDFLANFIVEGGGATYLKVKMLGDVPEYAFNNAKVNEIDLTLSKEIAGNGLYNNSDITKIIAPNPLIVGIYAFSGCGQAEGEITISEKQTILGDNVFHNCKMLKVTLHNKITSIGKYAFNNCESVDWTSLPSLLEYIPVYTFYKCSNLKITELPVRVREISQYAFAYCSSIETLKIHDTCTAIGNYAFRYCSGLKELELGTGFKSINGSYCFGNCTALEKITIHATTPPTLGSTVFNNSKSINEIRVPASALDTYKSASNWSKYADIMVGIEGE